jgi:hypothetical protein
MHFHYLLSLAIRILLFFQNKVPNLIKEFQDLALSRKLFEPIF